MLRRLTSETGVNKPFENVSRQGRVQNFFQGGSINFRHCFKGVFSGRVIFKQFKCQLTLRGSGGMLPRKFLKICILQWPF